MADPSGGERNDTGTSAARRALLERMRTGQTVVPSAEAELRRHPPTSALRRASIQQTELMEMQRGDLDRVAFLVTMTGYINAAPGFMAIPPVLDGASDLFESVFGEAGLAARTGVGVAELASSHPIETDLVVAVRS